MIQIHQDNPTHLAKLEAMLQDDPDKHLYRLDRSAFTDEAAVRTGDEAHLRGQLDLPGPREPDPQHQRLLHDYIGRQPIVITRNKEGELNAFINACTHRGAMLCRHKKGNKSSFTCPFHGWTFNNSGKLLKVKDPTRRRLPAQLQHAKAATT